MTLVIPFSRRTLSDSFEALYDDLLFSFGHGSVAPSAHQRLQHLFWSWGTLTKQSHNPLCLTAESIASGCCRIRGHIWRSAVQFWTPKCQCSFNISSLRSWCLISFSFFVPRQLFLSCLVTEKKTRPPVSSHDSHRSRDCECAPLSVFG